MGMYTQIRGWLNVDSIGDCDGENFIEISRMLAKAKQEFQEQYPNIRSWVCKDTIVFEGSNGCVYLFFGTELKNYDEDTEKWIKFLLNYFPNAEGRMDFQYEDDGYKGTCEYWLIAEGKVIKEDYNPVWCQGYGNMFKQGVNN
jgi:hypothetical protein